MLFNDLNAFLINNENIYFKNIKDSTIPNIWTVVYIYYSFIIL